MKESLVLCISGGLDSYGMWMYFLKNSFEIDSKLWVQSPEACIDQIKDIYDLTLLHVSLEQPYAKKERDIIRKLYPKEFLKIVEINGWVGSEINEDNFIIPVRNFVIANIAVNFGDTIWFAGIADEDHVAMLDKNIEVFNDLSTVLCKGSGRKIRVTSPFFQESWNKIDILAFLYDMGDLLHYTTTSCYHPTLVRCGTCFVCAKRWMAEILFQHKYKQSINFPSYTIPINVHTNRHIKGFIQSYFEAYLKGDYSHYLKDRVLRDALTLLKEIYDPIELRGTW